MVGDVGYCVGGPVDVSVDLQEEEPDVGDEWIIWHCRAWRALMWLTSVSGRKVRRGGCKERTRAVRMTYAPGSQLTWTSRRRG